MKNTALEKENCTLNGIKYHFNYKETSKERQCLMSFLCNHEQKQQELEVKNSSQDRDRER